LFLVKRDAEYYQSYPRGVLNGRQLVPRNSIAPTVDSGSRFTGR
jgi:hypothetical protein